MVLGSNMNYTGKLITLLGVIFIAIAPIINHIVYCFKDESYVLLLAGVLVPPVGWFHGIGLFFGWW